MLRLTAFAALVLLSACGPSIKPAMQKATDQLIGSYTSKVNVGAPSSYEPREWKAGQWIAFRTTEPGKPPSVTLVKVVASDDSGYWVETELQDYYGYNITKAYYTHFPKTAPEAMEALQKVVTKQNDGTVQEIDFASHPMAGFMKATMKHIASGLTAPTDVSNHPKEFVTVAAGSFDGAAKFETSISFGPVTHNATAWFHPAVPLNGSVKAVGENGLTYELLAFGDEGATSALP